MFLHGQSLSQRAIAEDPGRSQTVIHAFLKDPERHGTAKRSDRPPIISASDRRIIKREASKSKICARDIARELDLPVTVSRVQQIFREDPTLYYKKMKTDPAMTNRHKKTELNGQRYMSPGSWPIGERSCSQMKRSLTSMV